MIVKCSTSAIRLMLLFTKLILVLVNIILAETNFKFISYELSSSLSKADINYYCNFNKYLWPLFEKIQVECLFEFKHEVNVFKLSESYLEAPNITMLFVKIKINILKFRFYFIVTLKLFILYFKDLLSNKI
jgi:hypothetical protein